MILIQPLNSKHKKAPLKARLFVYGAQGRNRTTDTRIFSPLLYRLSYLGIYSYCACGYFVKCQYLVQSLTNVSSFTRSGICLVSAALVTL